MYFVSGNLKMS